MNFEEIMVVLESFGDEQTKRTFLRHGAVEPLFGVKYGYLKAIIKKYKLMNDSDLAKLLFLSNNYDAMTLASLIVNPDDMSIDDFNLWLSLSYNHGLSSSVARVAAISSYAFELGSLWIKSEYDLYKSCGYDTLGSYVMFNDDLDLDFIDSLLDFIELNIKNESNRTKYSMNNFIICVGVSVLGFKDKCQSIALSIGEVEVFMGNTACKVPEAFSYIEKTFLKNNGVRKFKKKRC